MKKKVSYKSLSKDELYLISRAEFEKQKLITTAFAKKLFDNTRKAANVLDRLTRKGRLLQIERGKYILIPIKAPNQLWAPNEFIIAKLWMGKIPYYIGYFTMYTYWGFTDQVPQTMFILNTKRSRVKIIGNVRYKAVKISEKKYYGIQKITIDNEIVNISDKERTLVDLIYNPIGSFGDIVTTVKNNIKRLDIDKFIAYLIKFPVISVRRRAGYMLERSDCPARKLIKLKKHTGNPATHIVLDPSKPLRKGKINKDWGLIVNR